MTAELLHSSIYFEREYARIPGPPAWRWWHRFSRAMRDRHAQDLRRMKLMQAGIDQRRLELSTGLQMIAPGDWVRFYVIVPKNETRPARTESITGVVVSHEPIPVPMTGKDHPMVTLRVESLPEYGDIHGFEWKKEATVPASALVEVSKPVPPSGEVQ